MANGTNKPGYMNSFMNFLENHDPDDPGTFHDVNSASGKISQPLFLQLRDQGKAFVLIAVFEQLPMHRIYVKLLLSFVYLFF